MKRVKSILFVAVVAGIFMGCKKEALEVNPDFEGEWSTGYSYWPWSSDHLSVKSDGSASFTTYNHHDQVVTSGTAKIKDQRLHIRRLDFRIDAEPGYDAEGNYRMILDSRNYYCVFIPEGLYAIPGPSYCTINWHQRAEYYNHPDYHTLQYKASTDPEWTSIDVQWNHA